MSSIQRSRKYFAGNRATPLPDVSVFEGVYGIEATGAVESFGMTGTAPSSSGWRLSTMNNGRGTNDNL
jgi:hypothetical protein